MTAYYNEIDAYPARWLQNLITAGHIAPGYVDNRSIKDVTPDDLKVKERTQAHFFAGIGVWSHALRLAGWPDSREVWTGSCPCQPFSSAGRRGGTDDPRHLWPDWFRLIRECHPSTIFGEQVASKDGLAWLDLVYDDLESEGYAVAALDLCAAGVGAPHIRQRLYFVAVGKDPGSIGRRGWGNGNQAGGVGALQAEGLCPPGILAHAERTRPQGRDGMGEPVGFTAGGAWSDIEWLACRDGKARPTQPGLFPLADGAAARVGRLRAYGNAIVAPLAAEFIRACMDVLG